MPGWAYVAKEGGVQAPDEVDWVASWGILGGTGRTGDLRITSSDSTILYTNPYGGQNEHFNLRVDTDLFVLAADFTGKGDLLVGTASEAWTAFLVGADGEIVVADDAQAEGIKWGDHGDLAGRGDDDHTIYSLADGTRAFTGKVGGIDPTADAHLATKKYVDDQVDVIAPGGGGGNDPDDRYILKSIGDDKGDLIGFSADNTPVKFPKADSDGLVLTSQNAGTAGVVWASKVTSITPLGGNTYSGAITIGFGDGPISYSHKGANRFDLIFNDDFAGGVKIGADTYPTAMQPSFGYIIELIDGNGIAWVWSDGGQDPVRPKASLTTLTTDWDVGGVNTIAGLPASSAAGEAVRHEQIGDMATRTWVNSLSHPYIPLSDLASKGDLAGGIDASQSGTITGPTGAGDNDLVLVVDWGEATGWALSSAAAILADGSVTFTAAQAMGSNKITGLANGTNANDAVNRSQLDTKSDTHSHPYIPNSIGDFKGDLVGFSAGNTPVKFPKAGSDGLALLSLAAGTAGFAWTAVVTSFDESGGGGRTGAITISEGNNITITRTDNNFAIAGAGGGTPDKYVAIIKDDDGDEVPTAPWAAGAYTHEIVGSDVAQSAGDAIDVNSVWTVGTTTVTTKLLSPMPTGAVGEGQFVFSTAAGGPFGLTAQGPHANNSFFMYSTAGGGIYDFVTRKFPPQSGATGDIIYYDAGGNWVVLNIGTEDPVQVLAVSDGKPSWEDIEDLLP